MKGKILIVLGLGLLNYAKAQKEIGNEEINITKERQVELQKANRIFDKIPPIVNEKKNVKMNYSFYDRKPTAVEETKFIPNVVNPLAIKSNLDDIIGYKNYFKIGFGNFGRIFGETYINSDQNRKLVYGISAFHNSTKRGPVDDENSATSINKIKLDGKYHQKNYELKMDVGYERRNFYFYGYDTTQNYDYKPEDLRQTINLFSFAATFENTNPKPKVDYSLSTGVKNLTDNYNASELDWGTNFKSFFPIIKDKVTALMDAEAYITQRTDNYEVNPTRKRNLYRVEPSFRFDVKRISAKIGFKAVNEYDQIEKINSTKGFPTVLISYKNPALIYFFAGFDGDIIRNTLHSFLNENPFIVQQANLLNTYKNQDFFIGSRGELFSGISYNTKISYGKYQNLYYYNKNDDLNDSPNGLKQIKTTKFQIDYEDFQTDFVNISTEIGYSNFENWKSNLKMDYFYYESIKFTKPYHRPSFVGRWGNIFTVSEKLVASLDFYYIAGLYAQDLEKSKPVKLKDITDLNAEFTYLFTKQFSAFVKLNNIIGQKYQRYYNYSQLGLNFVAGINVSL